MKKKIVKATNQGHNTIKVALYFHTDGIVEKGFIRPKHAIEGGFIQVRKNPLHRIKGSKTTPFNGIHQIRRYLRKLFKEQGIVLHHHDTLEELRIAPTLRKAEKAA